MLIALKKTLGVVTTACDVCGISRDTHYRYLNLDQKYAQAVKDIESIALDFVESKLFESIKKGAPASIIFYLKTKGKIRGYCQSLL